MSGARERQNTFFGGAAILTVAVILVKIIGAIYKIPIANILGDDGFGYFNQAYVIFNVLLTISTAGLPVALSKAISEANTLGRQGQAQKTFHVALITFLALGGISFLVMFFGASQLAGWMGHPGAVYAIRALSPCVFFVCVMAAFRGYAQGHQNMTPTSISQIIEAFLKLVVGLALASYVVSMTLPASLLPADGSVSESALRSQLAAGGAILGVTTGALVGLIYLIINFMQTPKRGAVSGERQADEPRTILWNLVKIAVPITLGASVVSLVTFIDTKLVLNRLQDALGYLKDDANALYGTYQTAVTLYNLPAALMVPLTASIIPAVSACLSQRNSLRAGRISESALRMAALIALPAGVGLTVLANPIVTLLYPKYDVTVAGPILAVLGIASIFVCIMLICNAILQANGFVNLPIITAAIGGIVKLIINYMLVGNPAFGIQGAPIGTLCCFGVIALLSVVIVSRVVPARPNFVRAFAKPLAASLLMGGAAWGVNGLLAGVIGGKLAVIASIGVGGVLYIMLVVLLRILTLDDLALMPKGDKIAHILHLK